jgi:UPF0176 protein
MMKIKTDRPIAYDRSKITQAQAILTIAGYKFILLNDLEILRQRFLERCHVLALKGTILLSQEGININLAGTIQNMASFDTYLKTDSRFTDMTFHDTHSEIQPFQRLKVKLRKEIITLRKPEVNVTGARAPSIAPEEFNQWIEEERDITILDTRNDYEVRFGTFSHAVNLQLADFSEFPSAIEMIPKNKPVVMFCTGGIRCEKAALYLLNHGYSNVYQLDGGILGYFTKVGGAHYKGECFVFDERVSVNAHLKKTGTIQCRVCQGPITPDVSCPRCFVHAP